MSTDFLPAEDSTSHAALPVKELDICKLYRDNQKRLQRFVRRYVNCNEDAEDIVQATFLEAVRCAHQFAGMSKPSTWLFGIAFNIIRNQARRDYRRRLEATEDGALEQVVDHQPNPAEVIELRQIARRAEMLMENLPRSIRETFEAVLDGECTYEEAAKLLKIPIGTVRSRVSRARAALRSSL